MVGILDGLFKKAAKGPDGRLFTNLCKPFCFLFVFLSLLLFRISDSWLGLTVFCWMFWLPLLELSGLNARIWQTSACLGCTFLLAAPLPPKAISGAKVGASTVGESRFTLAFFSATCLLTKFLGLRGPRSRARALAWFPLIGFFCLLGNHVSLTAHNIQRTRITHCGPQEAFFCNLNLQCS